MKGILPVSFRIGGYILLICSVFVPLLISMLGMVNDSNLVCLKFIIKLFVWLSLFMIFLAKSKEENAETATIRIKAMKYALYLWGVYYVVVLILGALENDLQSADNSVGIVYMVINVLCSEFLLQKYRIEKMFKKGR